MFWISVHWLDHREQTGCLTLMSSMNVMSSLWMGFRVQISAVYDLVFSSSPSFIRLMASLHVNNQHSEPIHQLSLILTDCQTLNNNAGAKLIQIFSPGNNLQVSHPDLVWRFIDGLKTNQQIKQIKQSLKLFRTREDKNSAAQKLHSIQNILMDGWTVPLRDNDYSCGTSTL